MNLSVGIVGLPNVGKSTLFNALLKKQQAFVANYPFATIEPNIGVVPVPDDRLEKLAEIVAFSEHSEYSAKLANQTVRQSDISDNSDRLSRSEFSEKLPSIKPATVRFVDVAGLVKGAAEGAGLGNKFLSHIREVSIICHVVRAFQDENVVREGSVDPKSDYETVNTELILADLQSLDKSKTIKKPSMLSSIDGKKQEVIEKINGSLNKGIPARDMEFLEEEQGVVKGLFLLSSKPEVVVLNVSEKDYSEGKIQEIVRQYAKALKLREEKFVVICAKIEAELADLSGEDQKQYLEDLGLRQSGLERLIKKAYQTLGLISFLTAGEKSSSAKASEGQWEVRAWTIQKGTSAVDAAGVIHTDFVKSFIKAEVVSYNDFVRLGGWKKCREVGKTRFEGRDYVVRDGDVIEFKIGS